jgi:hypothetical protein
MNSEKYIGLDVHQAPISVAVLDSTGKLVMESILETKAATNSGVLCGVARNFVGHLRRRNLGRVAARFAEAACGQAGGVQSTKKCPAQRRKQK